MTHWRFEGKNEDKYGGGWFIAFMDTAGAFSVVSDFGNYGYRWSPHPDIRYCLAYNWSPGYVSEKLAYHVPEVADEDAIIEAVKEHIIQMRRDGSFDKDEARAAWDDIDSWSIESEGDFRDWMNATEIKEPWEFWRGMRPQLRGFMKNVWPRLVEMMKADIAKDEAEDPKNWTPPEDGRKSNA